MDRRTIKALVYALVLLSAGAALRTHAQQTATHPAYVADDSVASDLPDAPLPAAGGGGAQTASGTVNGRTYYFPSTAEQLRALRHELIGVRPALHAAIRSGIEQIRGVPVGWGQDFPGYLQRYGSAYGEAAIDDTVRFGLALALHEDDRYLLCHGCSAGEKLSNAALSEVSARRGDDGHRTISPTPFVAALSGPLVAYNLWYPPGYTSSLALRHAALGVVTRIVFHLAREFIFSR